MRLRIISLAALGAMAGLAGCSEQVGAPLDAPVSSSFGKAYATLDSQIVPAPVNPAPPESSASRGVAAIARYEAGQVAQPATPATSAVSAATTQIDQSSSTSITTSAAPSP